MLNLEPPHFTQALAQRLDDDLQSYSRGLSLSNASAGECSVFVQPSQRFSTELSYGRHTGPPAHDSRRAAVITLLYWQHDEWFIPLTLRPTHLQDHGGQVSLPGGALESEETRQEAACRELQEELGIGANSIQLLGWLPSVYVFASNFLVSPLVATCNERPAIQANPAEVAQVLELPLTHLANPSKYEIRQIRRSGIRFRARGICFGEQFIWGATATILGSLLERITKDIEDV
ncbi:MAG: CoA pyrophosphatase [Pirellulaceae bacterium]|nr:CoA pyrophosphatase [Pirellulaceae bacterium]